MVAEPDPELLVSYTEFADVFPTRDRTVEHDDVPWGEIVKRLSDPPTYIDKKHCPLLSFAQYGENVGPTGCVRNGENVRAIYGVELDYDLEQMSIERGATLLHDAKIKCFLYTSASHTQEKPRWRVIAPLSEPERPEKRAEYVGRINRILGGVASRESFTLSQSYYFGRVAGAYYDAYETDGRCVDLAAEVEPLYPQDSKGVGSRQSDAQLWDAFEKGDGRYKAMLTLSMRLAHQGKSAPEIEAMMNAALGNDTTNADGIDLTRRTQGLAETAVGKAVQSRMKARLEDTGAPATDHAPRVIPAASNQPPAPPVEIAPIGRMLNWPALSGNEPPPREWAMENWLPHHHVTLLAGRGGIGKTLIAQQIATCLAMGVPYVSQVPKPLKVLMWAGEDDHDELWRRQIPIARSMGIDLADLHGRLIMHSYEGCDITLAGEVFGTLELSPMMKVLREQVNDYGADYVFLDNVARLFGGNESDRYAVTKFIAWLTAACAPAGVCLLGHPAKAQGSEYSGSTAWEGAVRARLYLGDRMPDEKPQGSEDDTGPVDPSMRIIARRKSNYSPNDWRRLNYMNGVLVPELPAEESDRPAVMFNPKSQFFHDVVRTAVMRLAAVDEYGNNSTASPSYLPKLALKFGYLGPMNKKQFAQVVIEMIKAGILVTQPCGQYVNRTRRSALALKV